MKKLIKNILGSTFGLLFFVLSLLKFYGIVVYASIIPLGILFDSMMDFKSPQDVKQLMYLSIILLVLFVLFLFIRVLKSQIKITILKMFFIHLFWFCSSNIILLMFFAIQNNESGNHMHLMQPLEDVIGVSKYTNLGFGLIFDLVVFLSRLVYSKSQFHQIKNSD